MLSLAALSQIGFAELVWVERRHAVESPLAVAPRPGTDDFTFRHRADGLEVPPVRLVNGEGIEPTCCNDLLSQ